MPGKRVQFDDETWHALDLLAKDRMQDFQELADETFADLLAKHGRPTDLKMALPQSVKETGARTPASSVIYLPTLNAGPRFDSLCVLSRLMAQAARRQ
jgi:hypothetical protein